MSELAWREEVIFLDTETTGLDIERHRVWDLAYIDWNGESWSEHQYYFEVPLHTADPGALRVNNLYDVALRNSKDFTTERYAPNYWRNFARRTANKHLVAAVPDFDARFCENELRRVGLVPAWHYHLIDIEAMMVGFLTGSEPVDKGYDPVTLPWRSKKLADRIGVPFDEEEFGVQHSALADARWVKACFEKMMGVGVDGE